MDTRKMLMAGFLAASVASTAAVARSNVEFELNIGPPPPIVEVVPAPRAGYVWAPGYWHWNGERHVWAKGHWLHERHGYVWNEDRWDHDGDRWHFRRGYWSRG